MDKWTQFQYGGGSQATTGHPTLHNRSPRENTKMTNSFVRPLKSFEEIRQIYEVEYREYGDETLSYLEYTRWWQRFKTGTYALFIDETVVGAIGMWPLTKSTYRDLTGGRLEETDITADMIEPLKEGQSWDAWYWAEIILARDLVPANLNSRRLLPLLLSTGLRAWVESGHLAERSFVCAIQYTGMGSNFLRHNGFRPCMHDSTSGHLAESLTPVSRKPVWELEFSPEFVSRRAREIGGLAD